MATNSTQNETPAWLNAVLPGAYGLIGLVVVVALVVLAIRFWAHKARLSDPQRALIDDFFQQVRKIEEAEKAMVQAAGRGSDGATRLPVLHIIVEESGTSTAEAEAKLEDVNCGSFVIRWVPVPPKSKKASTLAEVVGALRGGK
ncbi:hypothetical protein N7519_004399 [Penicillium mononematosum]|uniref:uncharacterized protein n=1 Tax=Penicillium mononematosum TaxID=268346 RepID=UPI002548E654|nr:uncharacterized protein N7519_004399 [Penicillium mononematosum]KAJ6189491.1 hypothetical protein N7519_004399 [Penicillium mononematosum]